MPNSRRRKKHIAANRRQMDRYRQKRFLEEDKKENCIEAGEKPQVSREENDSGWLSNAYSWCHSGLTQGVAVCKDVVFPSRVLKRQLDDAQVRLKEMEEELQLVKNREQKERKRRKKMRQSTGTFETDQIEPITISPPVAPPPPPPPSLVSERRVTRSRTKKIKPLPPHHTQPLISLDDIKMVKLKRVSDRTGVKRPRASMSTGFVVSLADLKSVNLKRASISESSSRRKSSSLSNGDEFSTNSIPEFGYMRHTLRRVNVARSPGGTVKRKLHVDSGDGPTPMLTRALKRKFEAACPLPLSPLNSHTPSPIMSPLSQALPSPPPPSAQTTAPPSPPPNSTQTTPPPSPESILEIREI